MKNLLKKNMDFFCLLMTFSLFYFKKDEMILNYNEYNLVSKQVSFLIAIGITYCIFKLIFNMDSKLRTGIAVFNIFLLTVFFIVLNAPTINTILNSTEKQLFLLTLFIPLFALMVINKIFQLCLNLIKHIITLKYYVFSKESRYNTLIHEVGHATLLAYLDRDLIIDTNIKVNKYKIPFIGYNGRLNINAKKFNIYDNKQFLEWNMLKSLAGNMSEQCIANKNPIYDSTGEDSDYTYWKNLAKQYLSSGFAGLYYPNPKNDEEIKTNIISMNHLKNEQEEILRELFLSNKDIINNFANEHLNKKINKKEIFDLCEKLIKIEKIPEIKEDNFIN